MPEPVAHTDALPLREATRTWFAISLQTFGGPAGQIAVMQRTLVDEKRWIGQGRFLHALNYCMLLPGPEAQQLAIYIGWLLNGLRGGLIAGTLFVLPGASRYWCLSAALRRASATPTAVDALFLGLAPAVIAIVIQAVVRVSRRALTSPVLVVLAVAAFIALAFFAVPFPVVILAAGAFGWLLGRVRPEPGSSRSQRRRTTGRPADRRRPPARRAAHRTPLGQPSSSWDWSCGSRRSPWPRLLFGRNSIFVEQGLFFSGAALVTFGGAYAVLAYVAQQAVNVYGWLAPGEMVRGLALAETTPGPLIMVVQFVAFVGAYRDPGSLNPWVAAVIAALLTTWVTFVPCFLFILLGAPYVERLRHNRTLSAALTGITAAVVGVIASLAAFFAVHTLFDQTHHVVAGPFNFHAPVLASIQWDAVAIMVLGCVLIFGRGWSVLRTLGACAIAGVALYAALAVLG